MRHVLAIALVFIVLVAVGYAYWRIRQVLQPPVFVPLSAGRRT